MKTLHFYSGQILRRRFALRCSHVLLLSLVMLVSGCSGSGWRFADAPPVTRYDDMRPVPVPEGNRFHKYYYEYNALLQRPVVKGLEVTRRKPAGDVNSLDEVPASSWYTPRLGYKEITPQQLLAGPQIIGPPQLPITVAKPKVGGGNPGFIIRDARGHLYLMKFDPPGFPAVETTTDLIVSRLYWGFGYNVPEDYLFKIRKEDLQIGEGGKFSQEDVDEVLSLVAAPENGVYRTTVSLFLKGVILGPIPATGRRKDDPNDRIAHENRRVLRALRVFNAFTNHTDMRIDNTLDVYEGKDGEGFVRHYLLDFGEAFAGHAMEHGRLWDGFTHVFSFRRMTENLFTLGLRVEGWENIQYTPWKSVGTFESRVFEPEKWKEVLPYTPIHYANPDDDYWAAKIVGALIEAHFRKLVEAAQYPEEGAADYVVKVLMERREKVLRYFFSRVSPLEFASLSSGRLVLENRGNLLLNDPGEDSRYLVGFYDSHGKKLQELPELQATHNRVEIALPASPEGAAGDYLRIDVLAGNGKRNAPRAAQFHLRRSGNGPWHLVGVVH